MIPKVSLYVRVTLPDGKRPFLEPVFARNHKLNEGWAVLDDQPQPFAEYAYYHRYLRDGKRVWQRLTRRLAGGIVVT